MPILQTFGNAAARAFGFTRGSSAASYELISTQVLGSAAASVTFSSINTTTYKHLQIRYTGHLSGSGDYSSVGINFNSDTASNYSFHQLYGNGLSASSSAASSQTYIQLPWLPAANKTAASFGGAIVDILDAFSTSKNKTVRALGGFSDGGLIGLESGAWYSTSAITTILLSSTSGNFTTGSRFSLYGVRG